MDQELVKYPYGFSFAFQYDRSGGQVTLSSFGNDTYAILSATSIELPGLHSKESRALYWLVSALVGPQCSQIGCDSMN